MADHINRVAADYPGSRHVVVAHSHGGNVALYALRDVPTPQPELITLATPFIRGGVRAVYEFISFIERALFYVIGVIYLLVMTLYLESLTQGTFGAWLISPCQALASCEEVQPLRGGKFQGISDYIIFHAVFGLWIGIAFYYIPAVIRIISEYFTSVSDILLREASKAPSDWSQDCRLMG